MDHLESGCWVGGDVFDFVSICLEAGAERWVDDKRGELSCWQRAGDVGRVM